MDTPITRANISELDLDTLDNLIADIRERRMTYLVKLEEIAAAKRETHNATLTKRFDVLHERVRKRLDKCESSLTIAAHDVNKLRAMQLELEG